MTNNIENAVLEPKLINDIKGRFYIPSYQRGYRWEKEHIKMLLNDIWENGDKNYSLQPVVVKKLEDETYELIDGQQRTTSVFLILQYIKEILPFELNFSLVYETRDKSESYLLNPAEELAEDNIDFHHIYNAYMAIDEWFNHSETDRNLKAINIYKYFGERVKVIWYEVNTDEDSIKLFTRLNIGKIPLTNAELVKALFLSKDYEGITEEKQLEIATSWDIIEKELQDDELWYFITNQSPQKYATRIEIIFNFIASKQSDEKEAFFTFFYFTEQIKKESKIEVWKTIQSYFLTLKEWYEKKEIYHKVGYLVAIGEPMQSIINDAQELTKSAFKDSLIAKIKDRLDLTKDQIEALSYTSGKDKYKIEQLLLLHNIETTNNLNNSTVKYSFSQHKNNNWSLEHIHAQQSQGLNKKEDQKEWIRLHIESLKQLAYVSKETDKINLLITELEESIDHITRDIFEKLFEKVFEFLSEKNERSYVDDITNMALLSSANNSALNNSTFDVKRNKIIEMDKAGEYIPISTRRVFFKYYTDSKDYQLHFWGEQDRKAYLNSMIGTDGILKKYLKPETNEN